MKEDDIHRQMDQYLANMQQQGIDPKTYYKLTGTTEDDLHKQFAADAERRVKTNLVLEAVVEAENIKPSQDEIAAEVKDLASQYNMEESAVRGALTDDMLSHDIAIRQAVDLIADSAKQNAKAEDKKDDSDKN